MFLLNELLILIAESSVVDRIINHLKLVFAAEKPPLCRIDYQELMMPLRPRPNI